MGGFAHALGHILKTGFNMTETGQRYNESNLRQRHEQNLLDQQDEQFAQHMMDSGARPVINGVVKRDVTTGDGTVIPGALMDKADPSRIIKHKLGDGKTTVQYEIATPEEQIGLHAARIHQAFTNPDAAATRLGTQTEAARGTGLTADATAGSKEKADERNRQRIGLPIGADIANTLGIDPDQPGTGLKAAAPLTDAAAPAPSSPADIPTSTSPQRAPVIPGKPRLLLPDELDKTALAAGRLEDYRSKADARLNPPAKDRKVHTTTPSADGSKEIVVYDNGDVEEKPVAAGLKPAQTDTEVTLAQDVARGKSPLATAAQKAKGIESELTLKRLDQSKREARPITQNVSVGGSVEAPSTTAQLVADYKLDLAKAFPYKTSPAERDKFLQQVKAVNPDYEQGNYAIANKTEQDAVTGKIGTQANALNTMMGHLGVLQQASLDLKNNDIQAINSIANSFGVATGSTAVTTYRTIVHRLAPEIEKAYVAGGGTAGERDSAGGDFADNKSPEQIAQAIGVSALLADSKIKALQKQYQDGTKKRGKLKLLTDESEGIRQHLMGAVPQSLHTQPAAKPPAGQIAVIAPDGTPGFMTPAALKAVQDKGLKFKAAQ